ncbi:MAG: hypothetical protein AAGB00_06310 [Planctomycetota bacterium]
MSHLNSGVIPDAMRIGWRLPYGDLPSVMRAAEFEYREGRLGNAWAAYQVALSHWLRERWIDHCGRPNSSVVDPVALADKLRSGKVFDKQLHEMIKPLCRTPAEVMHIHVDVAQGVVKALTAE